MGINILTSSAHVFLDVLFLARRLHCTGLLACITLNLCFLWFRNQLTAVSAFEGDGLTALLLLLLWTLFTSQSFLCQWNRRGFGHFWSVTYSILLTTLLNKQSGYPGFNTLRNRKKGCVIWKYIFNKYLLCSITEPFNLRRHCDAAHLSRGLSGHFICLVIMLQHKMCLESCDASSFLDLSLQIKINIDILIYRKKKSCFLNTFL